MQRVCRLRSAAHGGGGGSGVCGGGGEGGNAEMHCVVLAAHKLRKCGGWFQGLLR